MWEWKRRLQEFVTDGTLLLVADHAETMQQKLVTIMEAALKTLKERPTGHIHLICLSSEHKWWEGLRLVRYCSDNMRCWLLGPGNRGVQIASNQ